MINLFIPYYIDKDPARQAEIEQCIANNGNNKAIDKIFLICDDPNTFDNWFPRTDRTFVIIFIHDRPTYSQVFEIINNETGSEDWNVLINSDIYTDETIGLIKKYGDNDFLALSRWDIDKEGNAKHFNRWDSQDAWCFKGRVRQMNAGFYQGIAGCDNAIAGRAEIAGYNVINPSKTIKTYHLHNSGVRNYNPNERVSKPYKLITPTV